MRARAAEYKALGYTAQKWFFRHGPMSGPEGMRENVALVRTLRETLGDDADIMLDCWQSFDLLYAVELAERIAEYRPRWLEECMMPDRIDSYRQLKDSTSIPLSGAEHEYTRWGFKRFIDAEALDILQPDIYWAGGLSETLKIAAYASVHDLMVIPHGHSTPAGLHFSLAQSPILTPLQEYLVKWNAINQHFLAHPADPGRRRPAAAHAAWSGHGPGCRQDRAPDGSAGLIKTRALALPSHAKCAKARAACATSWTSKSRSPSWRARSRSSGACRSRTASISRKRSRA